MQLHGNEVQVVTHTCRQRTDWLQFSTVRTEQNRHFVFEGIPVWQLGFPLLTRARILPWAVGYYAAIGPAVRAIARESEARFQAELTPPDVVHVTRNGREFLSRAGLDFAHKHDVPFVLTTNHHPRWHGWRYLEYDKVYREADALFALTGAEKQAIVEEKGVSEEKVHVIGVGPILSPTYDVAAFREKYSLPGRYVLYLGQQFRYKGVGALLQAAKLVLQKDPDVTFVFVGPESSYSRQIFKGVKDARIRNLGSVDLETKTSALAGCEMLCLPSAQESFGGVYVEAWSMGKAVVGGKIPSIAALIDDGKDGLLSNQEPAQIAEAILSLLADPERCATMGTAGLRKVQARYTWDRIAEKTAGIYADLLGKQVAPSEYAASGNAA